MPRRASVVVNGRAGALLETEGGLDELKRAFAEHGITPEFVPAEAGGLAERIDLARRSGADLVVVAGGDGTVACAAGVLAGTDQVLGILPFGTMNLLAKDLHVPVNDLAGAVRLLADGQTRVIDVGEVNGQVFLCASMLGLPARLGRYREAERHGGLLGWARFAWNAVRATVRYVAPTAFLVADGRRHAIRTPSLTITVNALDDRSGRVFGRARLDGRVLASYAVAQPQWRLLGSLLSGLIRGRVADDVVTERLAADFVVEFRQRGVAVMNDGERMIVTPPLRYRVRADGLRVIGGSG